MNTKFEKLIKDIGYKQLSPYINSGKKVQLQCTNGHLIEMLPKGIKAGQRCAKCAGNCPEQAKQEFEKLIKDIGYKQLSPYINSGKKVQLQCTNGHIINMTPKHIKSGVRCAKCSNNCPEQAKQEFEKLIKDIGYKQLSPYIKNKSKVQLQCTNGHIIYMTPNHIKSDQRCAKCAGKCPEQARKEFAKLIKDIGYKQLSPYIKNKSKVQLQCTNGHIIEMLPKDIKKGKRCIKCAGICPEQSKQEFENKLFEICYKQLSPYIKNNLKVQLQCTNGHIIYAT